MSQLAIVGHFLQWWRGTATRLVESGQSYGKVTVVSAVQMLGMTECSRGGPCGMDSTWMTAAKKRCIVEIGGTKEE